MAVITRYIVVRNGVELDKVFEVKREADAYDKMLDAAEKLAEFINRSDLQINIDSETVGAISEYLAKNGPEVTKILKGIKPVTPPAPAVGKVEKTAEAAPANRKKVPGRKPRSKRKEK